MQNLTQYGYKKGLAPTISIVTGTGQPHSIISGLQTAMRNARERAGLGLWSSSLDQELGNSVYYLRQAGFTDAEITPMMSKVYGMLDKLSTDGIANGLPALTYIKPI